LDEHAFELRTASKAIKGYFYVQGKYIMEIDIMLHLFQQVGSFNPAGAQFSTAGSKDL
jgi:hypothetical protein